MNEGLYVYMHTYAHTYIIDTHTHLKHQNQSTKTIFTGAATRRGLDPGKQHEGTLHWRPRLPERHTR